MKEKHISKNKKSQKQFCSNCGQLVNYNPRYPKYICKNCVKLITDKSGRRIAFYNTHLLGYGCQGYYIDIETNKKYNSDICFIKETMFFAQEARFGGIIIQKRTKL